MTIASREIVNTFLNAQRQKRQSRGKQHGCLRAVRNGITVVKNASSRRERAPDCVLTIGMRIFLACCRIVESLLYVLIRDTIGGARHANLDYFLEVGRRR